MKTSNFTKKISKVMFRMAMLLTLLSVSLPVMAFEEVLDNDLETFKYSLSGEVIKKGSLNYSILGPVSLLERTGMEMQHSPGYILIEAGQKKSVYKDYTIVVTLHFDNGKQAQSMADGEGWHEVNNEKFCQSFEIPKDAKYVNVEIYYESRRSAFRVLNKYTIGGTKKTTKPAPAAKDYKGTMSRYGSKMEYSFSGGTVTDKKIKYTGFDECNMNVYAYGEVATGSTVKASCKKLVGMKNYDKVETEIYITTLDGKRKDLQEKKKDLSATVSAKVPLNAKQLHMKMTYKGRMGDFSCLVYWDVLDEASSSSNSFKWDDVGVGDRCSHCNGQFSNYYVNNFIGNVSIVCNSGKGKRKLESNNGKLQPIHYNDYFVTDGGGDYLLLDYNDETEVLKIMENSKVLLQKRLPNGSDRWVIYKGKIVGKGLKHAAEPSFQMSTCIVTPTGTTYVLEDDGKTSKVLLLEGSMEVTANKTSKKQTLKPGQIATVASNGTINVGSFDVGATAKQYGIKGISTSSTSNSNTSKTAHVNKSQSPQYQTGKQVEKGEVKANTNTKTNTKTNANANANADNTIYDVAATQPQYPGGAAALNSYIKNSIKYPADAKQQGVTGIVVVQFVVEKDGKLSDIKVSRKGKLPSLDAEALRVVKSLSKFTPGRNEKGQPVRVKYSLPVQFKLP